MAGKLLDETGLAELWSLVKAEDEKINKVGDIKTTVRTDLGDDWLLCNGDAVDSAAYPELANMIPCTPTGTWVQGKVSGNNYSIVSGCVGEDDRIVFIGGVNTGQCIVYYTDPNPTIPYSTLHARDLNGLNLTPVRIRYINNRYFLFVSDGNSVAANVFVCDDIVNGNFTLVKNDSYFQTAVDLCFDGEQYVLLNQLGGYVRVTYYDTAFTEKRNFDTGLYCNDQTSKRIGMVSDGNGNCYFGFTYANTNNYYLYHFNRSGSTYTNTSKGWECTAGYYGAPVISPDGLVYVVTGGNPWYYSIYDPISKNMVKERVQGGSNGPINAYYIGYTNNHSSPEGVFLNTNIWWPWGGVPEWVTRAGGMIDLYASGQWVSPTNTTTFYYVVRGLPEISEHNAYTYIKGR